MHGAEAVQPITPTINRKKNPGGSRELWREEQLQTSWRMSFRCCRCPAKLAYYTSIAMEWATRLSKVPSCSKTDKSSMQALDPTEGQRHFSDYKDGKAAISFCNHPRNRAVHCNRHLHRCRP